MDPTFFNLERHRETLLKLSREAIAYGLLHREVPVTDIEQYPSELHEWRATFVTLTLKGALRGCVGTLEAHRPLITDICHNAFAAAFADPRFAPLSEQEYADVDVEISMLSTPEFLPAQSHEDLLTKLRPGIDGLIVYDGYCRATFLPSVWESLSAPRDFLAHLKMKAGLPADYWSPTIRFERYVTEKVA